MVDISVTRFKAVGSRSEATLVSRPVENPSDGGLERPIPLPLLAVFGTVIGAKLISLAYGRADTELAFSAIVLPGVIYLSAVTLPPAWLGLALGPRIGLGEPRLAGLMSRQAGGLAVSLGAAVAEEVWFRPGLTTILLWAPFECSGTVK